MKIDWKRKWTSRKFLAMLSVFLMALVAFFSSEEPSVKIVSLIVAGVDIVTYIFGESYVDGASQYAKVEADLQWCTRTIKEIERRFKEADKGGKAHG